MNINIRLLTKKTHEHATCIADRHGLSLAAFVAKLLDELPNDFKLKNTYMTLNEAAELVGLSRPTITHAISHQPELFKRSFKSGTRQYVATQDILDLQKRRKGNE